MIQGFDVSKYQDPSLFDWAQAAASGCFLIARASYGSAYPDPSFRAWAAKAREHKVTFGAYHFYRQTQSAEAQLATFERQLESIGGLREGDLFPALDMEPNQANGDGPVNAKVWNAACDQMGDAWKERYGGCVLYMSSYFPDYLGAHKGADGWKWMQEPNYYYWLAHYGRQPGNPAVPCVRWHIHQHTGDAGPHSPMYAGAKLAIDQNVATDIELLRIKPAQITVPQEGHRCVPNDETAAGFGIAADGAELLAAGLRKLQGLSDG